MYIFIVLRASKIVYYYYYYIVQPFSTGTTMTFYRVSYGFKYYSDSTNRYGPFAKKLHYKIYTYKDVLFLSLFLNNILSP